jgi:3-methyladenine DNA glycosylase/8-oxoguanine DNA glycosylase
MKFALPARLPFNFLSVVNSHGWRQLAPFSYDEDSHTLCYVLRLANGRVIELKIRDGAHADGVSVETEKLEALERREVKEKVTWMFGLDMDFSRFYAASGTEPKLAGAKERALGRVLRSPTLFEDVIKTILTTNTLWAATRNMTRKLVDEFGSSLSGGLSEASAQTTLAPHAHLPRAHTCPGGRCQGVPGSAGETAVEAKAFPTPKTIAASSPEFLKEKIRVGYRASAIYSLAVQVASGTFDLEALKTSELSTLELRKQLLTIHGVGPYAAANLLMLLGRHDFIPIDSYAFKMVSHEWYRGKPVTAKEVEKRFEKWGEFKGLAYWLWDWNYKG